MIVKKKALNLKRFSETGKLVNLCFSGWST